NTWGGNDNTLTKLIASGIVYDCQCAAMPLPLAMKSTKNKTADIIPNIYIIILLTFTTFILGILGFRSNNNLPSKIRSWFTVILSLILLIVLFFAMIFTQLFSMDKEYQSSTESPDNNYKIDLFKFDGGAGSSYGIIGELNGPLWFKKRIYIEDRVKTIETEWVNNYILSINNHELNVKNGEAFLKN
ncbi:DUF5412 family protein, partial [Lentibacillus salicampi]|uniref:DUF5412 family protein n=1 Tax=Lentibacillus salicampi TaxID=175306 RepID=UPI0014305DD4